MRAVAYCRVSTNEEDQKNSLHNQVRHYSELFKHKEYSTVKVGLLYSKEKGKQFLEGIFADEGITGTKKKNRKAFEYMMKCAANREFDVIYCKNIARFARNVGDGANDLKALKGYGIKVIFEDGNLNYDEHEAIINMFLSMAQEESRAKSVAVKFGIRKGQKQGKWTSNTPYGYNRVDGYLKVNEDEARIVREVYEHYVDEGWGHNKILRSLNDRKVPTKKGGMWWQQHIRNILTNPIYKGVQINHKTENKDININLIKKIPEHDWIVNEIEELKIIPDDLWQQAQDIYKIRNIEYQNKHRYSDKNLLSTICRCNNCGGIMRRKKRNTKNGVTYDWVCQNNDMYGSGENGCKHRNTISENALIKFCKDRIEGYRNHKELLEGTLESYIEVYYTFDTESKLKDIRKNINELKEDFDNRIRLNGKGIITDEQLEAYSNKFKEELKKCEDEEHKLVNIDKEIEEVKRKYKNYVQYLDKVDIENLTNADLKKIFSKIVIGTYDSHTFLELKHMEIDEFIKQIEETGQLCFYNESKEEIKLVWAEHMFMDIEELKITEDTAIKEFNKITEENALIS